MIDSKTLSLFRERYRAFSLDGKGDDYSASTGSLTVGIVVNTDDPLENGRLQVFCPALNDNPKKIQHLPWAAYVMPFGGSINNPSYTRGTGDGDATSEGAVHYGFWGVPELGSHVLVGCIDGDPRRRFWAGSIPEHQETHTLFNGRHDWASKNGTPDGPLTSSKKPIQPIYDNWTKAFIDRKSREWKSRGADYQATSNPKDGNGAPSVVRGEDYLDETYEQMSRHEKDKWVREVLGGHGYDWSGFKGAGAFKASRVFGFSTPGFHSLSMDDRPFNLRTKIRSATGHMILLDDTNERIYLMTNKGNNWVEMDSNGNIDVYSERRVSISAAKDVNISAGGTFRVHAEQGMHFYSGHNDVGTQRTPLGGPLLGGEIRFQTETDFHVLANNIRNKSIQNTYNEVGINRYDMIGDSSFLDVKNDINIRTLVGDYVMSIAGNYFETVQKDSKRLSMGKTAITSQGDAELFSFDGSLAIGSKNDTTVKSASGNVDIEAMGQTSDSGSVRINSPRSQMTVGDDGISGLTSKSASLKAAENIQMEISPEDAGNKSGGAKTQPLNFEGVPDQETCDIGVLPPVEWTPGQQLSVDDAARICYNAGFRGQDLVIATALIGGESSYNPSAKNGSASNGKWGQAVGLFQIRTLNNPANYAGTVDELRDNTSGQLEDPNYNAKVAYQIFNRCSPADKWSVGKWESFQSDRYEQNFAPYVDAAATAVANLCSTPVAAGFVSAADIVVTEDAESCCGGYEHEDHEEVMYGIGSPSSTLITLAATGMTLRSATDIDFKSMSSGNFNSFSNVVNQVNSAIATTNMLTYFSSLLVPAITTLASSLGKSFSVPFAFSAGSIISKLYDSAMPGPLKSIAGNIGELNSMIDTLGGLGLTTPVTMTNLVGQLQGNAAALAALGLPVDMPFPVNPASFLGIDALQQLTKDIPGFEVPMLEIPFFRPMTDKLFMNNAYPVGTIEFPGWGGI